MSDKQIVRVTLGDNDSASIAVKSDKNTLTEHAVSLTDKLRKRMQGMKKQFFYASFRQDGSIKFGAYAPWQDW